MTDDELLTRLIEREGRRYTNRASDKGGPTRFGITLDVLRQWRHGAFPATTKDLQVLTEAEARQIYRHYFLAPFDDVLDGETKEQLVDAAVLHGVGRAVRWLQEALDVEVDGVIGPETRAALAVADLVALARAVLRARLRFVGRVVTEDYAKVCQLVEGRLAGDAAADDVRACLARGQAQNCAGWLARLAAFV